MITPGKGQRHAQTWGRPAQPAWQQHAQPAWLQSGQQLGTPTKILPPAAQQAAKAAAQAAIALSVFTANEKDDIGIRTLVGDYVEEGSNHGRKTYRKIEKISGHEDIDVYLYFWDERDGPDFSGWWFGSKVGGAQVWSRSNSKAITPPKGGWTIPWDGEVNNDLVVMLSSEKKEYDKKVAQSTLSQAHQEQPEEVNWEDRVQKASERVAANVIDSSEALDTAGMALEGDEEDVDLIKAATEALTKQATSLAETQRFLANEGIAAQKAPAALKADMAAFVQRVKKLQQQVKEELGRCRNYKLVKRQNAEAAAKAAEDEAKNQELEIQQQKQLEEMMPSVIEKVDTAEDEVEKVAIAAAPLQVDTADDLRPVMLQAIKETEQRVRAAQVAIGEAKRFITGKLTQVTRFIGNTKTVALEDMQGFQEKLREAEERINPYKTIRQDYEQRLQSKKILDELNAKIAGAEIEVEKASMMTAPLGGDTLEGMKEMEAAMAAAQSALSQSSRQVVAKLKTLEKQQGPVYEEVKALNDRSKAAQEKLDDIRKTVKETQVRVAADSLLKEAAEKVSFAEDELQKMSEVDLPFLKGTPKGPQLEELLCKGDEMAGLVHTALSDAQTFVAKKLVEVARFSEGHARAVREDLDSLQKRLSEGRSRLQQFKTSLNDRKRSQFLLDVETKIAAAEAEVRLMQEAAGSLGSIGEAGEKIAEGLQDTIEKANIAERSAQEGIVLARKILLQKTAELKNLGTAGMGAGGELGKFQTRVNNMQQEIAKLRNSTKEAEERVRAKQTLSEVALRVQEAEQDVDKVATMSAPTDDELPSIETVEHLEKQSKSTQTKLGATLKLVDVKLKTAQGFLKDELQAIHKRLSAADRKLNSVLNSSKEQREQVLASEFAAEATRKVDSAEAALTKAQDAELPFLKGIEVIASEAVAAVEACEVAANVAQKLVADAKSYVNEKLVEAKRLAERPSQSCLTELNALQKRVEVVSKKTAELKKDTAERRRRIQMQSSADRIAAVEGTVQDLASTMAKFADDKLSSLSADDARRLTEDIAAKEQMAKRSVSGARKFLSERLTEMRGYPDAVRSTMMTDLTKLQSRLTQCQVELAKLSNQCSEREQRFVAQRLIEDATESLDRLKADIESASQVSTSILEGDRSQMLRAMNVQAVSGAIQGYLAKANISMDELFTQVTKNDEATEDEFAAFLDSLSELTGREDIALTKEQAVVVFAAFAVYDKGLTAAAMKAACLETGSCIMAVALMSDLQEGATELTVVEVGEAVTTSKRSTDSKGNTHGHCTLARDGETKGWVLLQTVDGSNSFKPAPYGASHLESVVAYVAEICKRCVEAAEAVEQKAQEVSTVKTGPLAEVKAKLLQLKMKLSQEQTKIEQLKVKVGEARSEVTKLRRDEQQKVQDVKCREFAAKSVKEATAAVEAAEAKASAVIENSKNGDGERTLAQLEKIKASADEAVRSLEDAKIVIARIQNSYEGFKASTKQSLLEARVEMTKLKTRAETSQRKCTTATESVRVACNKLVKAAIDKARQSLRASARSSNSKSYDELFSQLAGGREALTEDEFHKFVSGLPKHGLSKERISMMYGEFGPNGGMKKLGFAKLVQEFCSCAKSVAITDGYDIDTSTSLRKLEPGELWEVLEGPRDDAETQVSRVRGRAVRDGVVGWVTVKSGQGAPYLKPTEKPYMSCVSAATLQESFDASSSTLRALAPGEVLELMEGPREDSPVPEVRLKCRASSDGKEGWMTVRSGSGENASASSSFYVCKSLIAMTDVADLKTCKVQKKVVVGEVLQVLESEKSDKDPDINRMKFRSLKDGREGWVSIKGNQGTIYLEVSNSHYLVERSVSLSSGASGDSGKVRELAVGEAIEALAPPVEEKPDSKHGFCARAVADGRIGWVFFSTKAGAGPPPVKPCSPKL